MRCGNIIFCVCCYVAINLRELLCRILLDHWSVYLYSVLRWLLPEFDWKIRNERRHWMHYLRSRDLLVCRRRLLHELRSGENISGYSVHLHYVRGGNDVKLRVVGLHRLRGRLVL